MLLVCASRRCVINISIVCTMGSFAISFSNVVRRHEQSVIIYYVREKIPT